MIVKAYNHENTRVSKTVNADTTHFIYDGAKLIGEYNSDGSVKNEYIYLDNIPVGVIPRGYPQDGVKYIHADHLGTPRRLADENGNIVWSWESEPFGESKAVGSVEFNLRFAGQYYDDETSTHYNINRDYDPETGRYIESDPIGFDGGVNSYGYVGGNPLVAMDEMGLDVAVITGDRYSESWNIAGHAAMAITNMGVYSWGTDHPFNTRVDGYVWKGISVKGKYVPAEVAKRNVTINIIKSTPVEDAKAIYQFQAERAKGYSITSGRTCASAVLAALKYGLGKKIIMSFLPMDAESQARQYASTRI